MRKTAVITARIEPELKASAGQICAQLGLALTQAITLFLRQLELQQGLPFDLKVPPAAAHPLAEGPGPAKTCRQRHPRSRPGHFLDPL
ncbi:MAG TPA: type II toxin-antitoxin system RelB/DinJ family antitoxin [Anaerolineae bacterium]|nr:type II toxin-antitoxin system RelB/DinJ family antitoxin [Anaerolineae bacterium]